MGKLKEAKHHQLIWSPKKNQENYEAKLYDLFFGYSRLATNNSKHVTPN